MFSCKEPSDRLSEEYDDQKALLSAINKFKIDNWKKGQCEFTFQSYTLKIKITYYGNSKFITEYHLSSEKGELIARLTLGVSYYWKLKNFVPDDPNMARTANLSIYYDGSGDYKVKSFTKLPLNTTIKPSKVDECIRKHNEHEFNIVYDGHDGSMIRRGCRGFDNYDRISFSDTRKWVVQAIEHILS